MSVIVCTLVEKHYHYGVAALVNSLHRNGFTGSVYVGYRGKVPDWGFKTEADTTLNWSDATLAKITDSLHVHFLPIKTHFHFTFYKAHFMLDLFTILADKITGIAYFDPDVVIKTKWITFERWMGHGVAVVHEVRQIPETHPKRGEWKKVINKLNRQPTRNLIGYINGGFCGVLKENIDFLIVWKEIIEAAIEHYGLKENRWRQTWDESYIFYNADQDAMNIAAMCSVCPISEIGPEAMDLIPGGFLMSHALGSPKPWKKNFIRSAIAGVGVERSDKAYWTYTKGPIKLHSDSYLRIKGIKMAVASFIGRFNRRA